MRVGIREVGRIVGRVLVVALLLAIAVWVVWTWPWAPLMWLGVALLLVAAVGARRMLARR